MSTEIILEVIRHSTAHLLAHAVKMLYPQVQLALGPAIENGFYYDFANQQFQESDLVTIEHQMHLLVEQQLSIERSELTRAQAIQLFADEPYKLQVIASIPLAETISIYRQGDFIDICRGPHVANTAELGFFKLTKLAGAYWRGNSDNEMLQRIYGTAWDSKITLAAYLQQLSEAEKRDHRKLAKQLDLFHLQEEAPGMIFWHANGWIIWQEIEQYMRKMYHKYGYQEVKTPQVVSVELWKSSGHWDKFQQDMLHLMLDDQQYAIKPMNCPCHVQIYKQGITSYRELPLRLAEFGCCHRYEASGALHGIMRTRSFTQDDGHIFCTEEQITEEVSNFLDMLFEVYHQFGLTDVSIKLSTRPTQRIGAEAVWDKAEASLAAALDNKQLAWELLAGEGAFYGPKIEFVIKDCIGRAWTTGTIQLDFLMPERLNAHYIDAASNKQTPVMLHRAICGSLERFIGILLEHYAGILPLWLAPVQAIVLNISAVQIQYTAAVQQTLLAANIRTQIDISNEKISYKIRNSTLRKIPYLIIVGEKEVNSQQITVRALNGTNLGSITTAVFISLITQS